MSALDIVVQEVSPRDGLQIEPQWVSTDDKVTLIDGLSGFGFSRIEVSSFVSAKAIPALRDAAEVFARIRRDTRTTYVALVPNLRGAEAALTARADELNLVMSVSETHNLANMRMTGAQSFAAFEAVAAVAEQAKTQTNGTIATAFGCPFEGGQPVDRVLELVRRYLDLGLGGITLADTTGMANPRQVKRLVGEALDLVPAERLTLHFHNTRGLGLANVLAAHEAGARRFDASLGGLGGCPFAPGASGNVCTEDLVNMADEMGLRTGLDLSGLIELSKTLPALVGHELAGQVVKAGSPRELHAAPPAIQAA